MTCLSRFHAVKIFTMNRIAMSLGVVLFLAACGLGSETVQNSNESATLSSAVKREGAKETCESFLTERPRTRAIARAESQAKAECPYCTVLTLQDFAFDCPFSTATQDDVYAAADRAVDVVSLDGVRWSTGTARGMTAVEIANEFGTGTTLPVYFSRTLRGELHGVAVVGSVDQGDGRNDFFLVWGDGTDHAYVVTRAQVFP